MDALLDAVGAGPFDVAQVVRAAMALAASVVLGTALGLQREMENKPAGIRTHVLVTLAATIFVMVPAEAGMALGDLSRVIQGVATGIGFIGAGAILKVTQEREVQGLTTATTLWIATAVGVAIGLGRITLAALGVALTWVVLAVFSHLSRAIERRTGASRGAAHRDDSVTPR